MKLESISLWREIYVCTICHPHIGFYFPVYTSLQGDWPDPPLKDLYSVTQMNNHETSFRPGSYGKQESPTSLLTYHRHAMTNKRLRSSDAFMWRCCASKTFRCTGLPCRMCFWCYAARASPACLHLACQSTTQMSIELKPWHSRGSGRWTYHYNLFRRWSLHSAESCW